MTPRRAPKLPVRKHGPRCTLPAHADVVSCYDENRVSAVPSDHEIIHALADDLPVGLWVARAPGGEFVYANRRFAEILGQGGRDDAAVGGYSEPYGILTRDGRPYPEDKMPFVRALQEQCVVVVDDIMIRRPDRSIVHVRAFANPVMKDGTITHVVICFFDISREIEAEQAKVESEKRLHRAQRLEAIGTLAGGIAHDFNNLVFGIKLLAAELAAGEADAQRRASLRMIDDITERTAMLTRSLLGFAGRGKHRAVPVALNDVIESMRELLTRTLRGVEISFDLQAIERGTVIGDHSQLEQVVMNLVVNARDALTERGGKVCVRTTTEHGNVVLEVADDGPGIPLELRERVFEPYFTTKTHGSQRGTGLGLATVFGIVESHKGNIDIREGLDGAGVTLRVTLPGAAAAAEEMPKVDDRPVEPGSGTILVVDDDVMVRRAVSMTLRGLGYTTFEAASGFEAVDLYRQHHAEIRAVVLDVIMPGMSGRATYTAMRAVDPSVTVLLMSGYTKNEEVQALLEEGARGFVMKPYSVESLARTLAAALRDGPTAAS
jgi:two-component system cell cycle sensor histidine kinase/response regulator CckA